MVETASGSEFAMARIDVSLLSDRVYRALREDIFRKVLLPAARLDVRDLAAMYGTSAAPVRHALVRLQDEGLVEIQPRRGTFVTRLDLAAVAEVFQIRLMVELGVAERLGARLPDDAALALTSIVEQTEALADGNGFRDYSTYLELDLEFHRVPLRALQNVRLVRLFDSLHTHIHIARGLYPTPNKRAELTLAEHRAILDAYHRRNIADVKAAILEHLANSEADLLHRLEPRGNVAPSDSTAPAVDQELHAHDARDRELATSGIHESAVRLDRSGEV